jgi:hypothetical protein
VATGHHPSLAAVHQLTRGAENLRHPLQKLPADHTVRFDERAEVPIRDAVAEEILGGGDRRRTRTFVEERNLAEEVGGTSVLACALRLSGA